MLPDAIRKQKTTGLAVTRPTVLQLNEMIKDVRSPLKAQLSETE